MVATDTDLEAQSGTAEAEVDTDLEAQSGTDVARAADPPAVDVNVLYDQAVAVLDGQHPGATAAPLEPTDAEPSPAATLLGDGRSLVMIDGVGEGLETAALISAVTESVTGSSDLAERPMDQAGEGEIRSLMEATTFRTVISAPEGELGELRLTVGVVSDESEPEKAPAEPGQPQPAPTAAVREPETTAGLAERLPNLAAVDMNVSVELGRVRLPIRELLGLGTGSVIRLGTPIGESFDILVNGKAAARGDLVVVGGRLAVRIRELLGVDA